jgi:nitrogen fixation/metabolism regulation signal transduction histidine kinase
MYLASLRSGSIRMKLGIAFGVLGAIALSQSLVTAYYSEKFVQVADHLIASRQLEGVLSRVAQIDSSFTAVVQLLADNRDTAVLPYYDERMAQYRATLATLASVPVSPEEAARLTRILATRDSLFTLEKRIMELGREDKFTAARLVLKGGEYTNLKTLLSKLVQEQVDQSEADAAAYEKDRGTLYAHMRFAVYGLLLLLIIVGAGLLYAVATRMVRTLLDIEEAARAIGRGELGRRVPVLTADEVGRAAVAFNKMAVALDEKNMTARLQKITEEIGQ